MLLIGVIKANLSFYQEAKREVEKATVMMEAVQARVVYKSAGAPTAKSANWEPVVGMWRHALIHVLKCRRNQS